MTQPDHDAPAFDCTLETIIGFMLPFFLIAAGGNQDTAKAVIRELIDAYNASTPMELDLVGRVIGFSIASMDNLRLSMTPGLSDSKILRYRCNAVTLSRASDQALKMLEAVQAKRAPALKTQALKTPALKTPRPTVAVAPDPVPPRPVVPPVAARPPVASPRTGLPEQKPQDIEAMKRDARVLLGAFSKHGAQASVAFPVIPDPSGTVTAAARQAVAAARRP